MTIYLLLINLFIKLCHNDKLMDEFKLNRVVTRIPTPILTWLDSKTKGLNYKRSKVLKSMINEHKLCEDLTGKTVWQVIKDNIELRKEIAKLKRYG